VACGCKKCESKLATLVLGVIIRGVRERREISRTELAEQMGRSLRWVQRVEAGSQGLTVEGLFRVAGVLGTSPRVLVGKCCSVLSD